MPSRPPQRRTMPSHLRAAGRLLSLASAMVARLAVTAPAAELIMHGGNIITLDPQRPRAEALAVAEGRILDLGTLEEMRGLRGPQTQETDLGGAVLLPAFVDHHVHLFNVGLALLSADDQDRSFSPIRVFSTPGWRADRPSPAGRSRNDRGRAPGIAAAPRQRDARAAGAAGRRISHHRSSPIRPGASVRP